MRVSEIRFQIEQIQKIQGSDDEKAHSMEDTLYTDVLQAIAKGSKNATKLAQEALKAGKLSFQRNCS